MTRNQIGLVPTVYSNPGPNSIGVPNAINVDEYESKIFTLAVGVTLYIFSQVFRSVLTSDKEPERPEQPPAKAKPQDNMMAEEKEGLINAEARMNGDIM